jgi:voltage-gated potassium channel Kch
VLVAGKNGLDSQHHGPLVEFVIAEQRRDIALRVGQGMVVADQDDSGLAISRRTSLGENFLIGAVGLAKIAEVLASANGIDGANLTLDAGDGVELGGCVAIVGCRWWP